MQIRDYLLRRLMVLPILLVGVSIIVFTLTRVGGSPIGIYLSHEMTPEAWRSSRTATASMSRCRCSISPGRRGPPRGPRLVRRGGSPGHRGVPEQAGGHDGARQAAGLVAVVLGITFGTLRGPGATGCPTTSPASSR